MNAAIWNARRYAWDEKSTEPLILECKHTKEEADDAVCPSEIEKQAICIESDIKRLLIFFNNKLRHSSSQILLCLIRYDIVSSLSLTFFATTTMRPFCLENSQVESVMSLSPYLAVTPVS